MSKSKNLGELPSQESVVKFDMLFPMLQSDLNEIRELSKKKQDEPLNKFKVKTINKKLEQVKTILAKEPTNEFLELLDEDTFPSNSDAVLMISQFIKAMEQFKQKFYYRIDSYTYQWLTVENPEPQKKY
jgi:hypothetical protein